MSKKDVDIVSMFEQAETSTIHIAIILKGYYMELTKDNIIPPALLKELMLDAQKILLGQKE